MTFLAPAFLWTFAALAALAMIYFLKVRPRKKTVTAYFLWQRIFTEKKASALFKRLRDLWSLLLMALAFAAVALALAEPDLHGDKREDLLIVIDHSVSMSAKQGGTTRLDLAKEKARSIIKGLHGAQRAAVASFADTTHILAHPTRHRKALLDAVNQISPTQLASRVDALHALQPGSERATKLRMLLITDAALDAGERLPQVEVLRIASDEPNVGIAHADLRPLPGGSDRLGLFIIPVSSFHEEVSCDLLLTHEDSGQLMKVVPVTLKPDENPAITMTLDDAPRGKWTASLSIEDALAVDDTAHFFVAPTEPLPVALAGDDPFFWQQVVAAFERSDQLLTLAEKAEKAKFTLAKGSPPKQGSAIVIHPQAESELWLELGEELPEPVVPQVIAKEHPLLRYLDAETLSYSGAKRLKAPAGAVVLVADEGGTPLIYLLRRGEHTQAVLNLDPTTSRFYLSAWFPVLIHNAALHLANREVMPAATLATGSALRVPGLAEGQSAVLKSSASSTTEIAFTGPETGALNEAGFHEVTIDSGAGQWTAGVSVIASAESLAGSAEIKESTAPLASGYAPSYWLLVGAVVLLTGESILYHRRKVG
ncbi:VWA domain-containing protein [Phragmitibacter flavus]|uniref:VWA domain-containing protein n=1 Tax=Phragmitibacter flavus TaxID=2576071 RepID=A0A5R8KCS7_9BACT|nr:BatA and WFA domain-containing protein [Phragmitibacter flavus]TLD70116.1 VWA domain-containing protein [Phragmitibacter flavus]